MTKEILGNIFTTKCKTIVNTVNCVGVMGAGIALECRLRYPNMYEKYVKLCRAGKFDIGLLWLYKADDKWILNLPTKKHWKYPSKEEYLHAGLQKFIGTYEAKGIETIAFPLLGADRGGIDQAVSLEIMHSYLDDVPIDIEIYLYDPAAKDDLYDETRKWFLESDIDMIEKSLGLKRNYIDTVREVMLSDKISQLNQLANEKGIGIKTLEKIYRVASQSTAHRSRDGSNKQ